MRNAGFIHIFHTVIHIIFDFYTCQLKLIYLSLFVSQKYTLIQKVEKTYFLLHNHKEWYGKILLYPLYYIYVIHISSYGSYPQPIPLMKGITMIYLGSHVGMSGKEMFLGSVKEALSYGANTFMVYTGAPQNTRRKNISELRIDEAKALMQEHSIGQFIVHAPYIINLANSIKPETFELAVEFLKLEIERTAAMGSQILVLHPGSHVEAGVEAGTKQIIKGLNMVLTADTPVYIALETMAGKGSEIGRTFEEIKAIYDGVEHAEKLRVCMDTCHLSDAGYPVATDFDGILAEFDRILGLDQLAVIHINDSKNPQGAHKDRHANLGDGHIGFEALKYIVHHPKLENIPKILETPYIDDPDKEGNKLPPYKEEIQRLLN